jgi:hypothetical protein
MNCVAAGVITTCTCAPAFTNSLTNNALLYAAMLPDTPTIIFLLLSKMSFGLGGLFYFTSNIKKKWQSITLCHFCIGTIYC